MTDTIEHRNGKHRCGVCWEYGWVLESEPIRHNEEHLAEMAAADDPRKDPDPGPDSPQPIVEAVADKPEAIVPAVVQIPHAPIALNTVTQGDCLDLLPGVASASVDIVPYPAL